MQNKRTNFKNIFHSKFLFLGLVLFFTYIGYSVMVNVFSFISYKQEEGIINESIVSHEEEKKALEDVITLLGSDAATENIARTKLGWTKVGETTVVFTENETRAGVAKRIEQSNIQKWGNYFFNF
jgi:cell division protein FtsB